MLMDIRSLDRTGLKWSFTSRRVTQADAFAVTADLRAAQVGDLVLCQVEAVGQHRKIQLADRRPSELYPGDRVVLCLGNRYAPDQFEGFAELSPDGADMLAGGGIVGRMNRAHMKMAAPTRMRPLGLLCNAMGQVLNVAAYALPARIIPDDVTVLGVFGASMNAGKTTAAVSLAHGLSRAGFRVAGVKATGTGAFGDFNAFEDAGVPALDFTDAGMPTTYLAPMQQIEAGFHTLVGTAAQRGAQIVVVEIADGVFQTETAAILRGGAIRDRLDGVLFAASDALGAMGGTDILTRHGLRPFAVSGMVTCSPLAQAEAAAATGLPLLSRQDLICPDMVMPVVGRHLRQAPQVQAVA